MNALLFTPNSVINNMNASYEKMRPSHADTKLYKAIIYGLYSFIVCCILESHSLMFARSIDRSVDKPRIFKNTRTTPSEVVCI